MFLTRLGKQEEGKVWIWTIEPAGYTAHEV